MFGLVGTRRAGSIAITVVDALLLAAFIGALLIAALMPPLTSSLISIMQALFIVSMVDPAVRSGGMVDAGPRRALSSIIMSAVLIARSMVYVTSLTIVLMTIVLMTIVLMTIVAASMGPISIGLISVVSIVMLVTMLVMMSV